MDALRTYLLAQLKAPRCADNVTATVTPSTFNAAVRRARADFDVKPIEADCGAAAVDARPGAHRHVLAIGRRRPPARRGGAAARAGSGRPAAPGAADAGVAQPGGPAAHRRRAMERRERAGRARLLLREVGVVHVADRSGAARARSARGRCARSSNSCAARRPTSADERSGSRSSTACWRSRMDHRATRCCRRWKNRTNRCCRSTRGSSAWRRSASPKAPS